MRPTLKQVIAVRCRTCGAAPGQKCELSIGLARLEPHQARRLAAGDKGFRMAESEKTASSSLPRRDWHVVVDNLKNDHDPVRRHQLQQELLDSLWFCSYPSS
jgi:hypothetical protein